MGLFNFNKKDKIKECSEDGTLLDSQPITITEKYQSNFIAWLESPEHRAMVRLVHDNCHAGDKDEAFMTLSAPSVEGMTYVYNPKRWEEQEFFFLFDFLSQQLQKQGYKAQDGTSETWKYPHGIEKTQSCKFANSEHYFDKILMRVVSKNDKVHTLKMCACHSSKNSTAQSTQSFQTLIQQLTQ